MQQSLNGRRALVTGGDSGIGAGVVEALRSQGADVVVADLDVEPAARAVRMDVSSEDSVASGFADAARALGGPVDLLVNNAGIEMPHALVDMPLEDWRKVLDVNLTGAFLCSREAARGMIAAGTGGAIVNVSSVHEHIPWRRFSHYCASKGGMKLFAQSVALELAEHGIRVVSIAPGAIETPINRGVLDDPTQREAVTRETALGRWGEPGDVAAAVAWAASDAAGYVTGTTIVVDGGMSLYPKFT